MTRIEKIQERLKNYKEDFTCGHDTAKMWIASDITYILSVLDEANGALEKIAKGQTHTEECMFEACRHGDKIAQRAIIRIKGESK